MGKDVRKFGFSDKRGRVITSSDPYLPEEALKDGCICESCHTLYQSKRWVLDPVAFEMAAGEKETLWVTCPACQKVAGHQPEGIVTLRGEYLWNHEEEIRNILNNEGSKALERNPLERIMSMDREGDELIIETTDVKLAEHLGRALHRAHHGDLKVTWSPDPSVCRVNWER